MARMAWGHGDVDKAVLSLEKHAVGGVVLSGISALERRNGAVREFKQMHVSETVM